MQRNFNYKPSKQPVYDKVRKILSLIFKKPLIINLSDKLEDKAIYLSTHCAKIGPPYLDLYFPKRHSLWGAHGMLGTYKDRFHYLRDVYYVQKMKKNKFIASILSSFEAIFNIFFYKGMRVIPTYPDIRFIKTIRYSIKSINNNLPVMIFPEDSTDGYKEVLTGLLPGFIKLSEVYYKKYKIDLPVYPVYTHKKKKIIIGKPLYIKKLKDEGLNDNDICDRFKDIINKMYYDYVENKNIGDLK